MPKESGCQKIEARIVPGPLQSETWFCYVCSGDNVGAFMLSYSYEALWKIFASLYDLGPERYPKGSLIAEERRGGPEMLRRCGVLSEGRLIYSINVTDVIGFPPYHSESGNRVWSNGLYPGPAGTGTWEIRFSIEGGEKSKTQDHTLLVGDDHSVLWAEVQRLRGIYRDADYGARERYNLLGLANESSIMSSRCSSPGGTLFLVQTR